MRCSLQALVAVVVAVLVVPGCSHHGARHDSTAPPSKRPLPAFLSSIPADTPYLLVALEAMPRDYYAKIGGAIGPTFSAELDKKAATDPDLKRFLAALHHELDGKWSVAGLESLGFSTEPRFAVYGLGPVFVTRFELRDQNKALAMVTRVAATWGKSLPPPITRAAATYWRIDDAKLSVVVGLASNQLVFAVGAPAKLDAELDVVLGLRMPARNLGDGVALARVMDRHRLGPYLVGIVETRRLIDMVVTGSDPVPPGCVAQLDALSQLVPRIVLGHTRVSPKQFSGGVIVELAPDLVRALRALHVAVPGLTPALGADAIVSFGGGLDLGGARGLTRRAGTAVETLAAACNSTPLHELGAQIDKVATAWIPSPLDSLTGFAFSLQDYARSSDGSKMPERLQGIGVLGSTDAPRMFSTIAAGLPWIGGLGIEPDGTMHEIMQGMTTFGIHAGVGDRALVLAAGPKGRALGEQVLADKPEKDAPFLAMSYDYPRLVALERVLNLNDKSTDATRALEDVYVTLFGHGTATLDVADDGLVLWSTIDLK